MNKSVSLVGRPEGTHPLLTFAWQVLQEGAESLEQHLGLEALMSSGRVDNLAVVMGLHPDYLSRFWRLHYLLLHTDGPLASSWRHYIAIMVSLSVPDSCRGGHGGGGGSAHRSLCWGLPELIIAKEEKQNKALALSDHPQNFRF